MSTYSIGTVIGYAIPDIDNIYVHPSGEPRSHHSMYIAFTRDTTTSTLYVTVLDQTRRSISILLPRNVIHSRKDSDAPEHDTTPVHRLRINRSCGGKEAEEKEWDEEDLRRHIDCKTPFPQGELARGHGFAAEPLGDDAAN